MADRTPGSQGPGKGSAPAAKSPAPAAARQSTLGAFFKFSTAAPGPPGRAASAAAIAPSAALPADAGVVVPQIPRRPASPAVAQTTVAPSSAKTAAAPAVAKATAAPAVAQTTAASAPPTTVSAFSLMLAARRVTSDGALSATRPAPPDCAASPWRLLEFPVTPAMHETAHDAAVWGRDRCVAAEGATGYAILGGSGGLEPPPTGEEVATESQSPVTLPLTPSVTHRRPPSPSVPLDIRVCMRPSVPSSGQVRRLLASGWAARAAENVAAASLASTHLLATKAATLTDAEEGSGDSPTGKSRPLFELASRLLQHLPPMAASPTSQLAGTSATHPSAAAPDAAALLRSVLLRAYASGGAQGEQAMTLPLPPGDGQEWEPRLRCVAVSSSSSCAESLALRAAVAAPGKRRTAPTIVDACDATDALLASSFSDAPAGSWPAVYEPRLGTDVVGNAAGVSALRRWLQQWRKVNASDGPPSDGEGAAACGGGGQAVMDDSSSSESDQHVQLKRARLRRAPQPQAPSPPSFAGKLRRRRPRRGSSSSSSGGTGSADGAGHSGSEAGGRLSRSGLLNTSLIVGPPGSGKTAAVRALALELGYEVLEVSAAMVRSRRTLVDAIGEATQSRRVQQQQQQQQQQEQKGQGQGGRASATAAFSDVMQVRETAAAVERPQRRQRGSFAGNAEAESSASESSGSGNSSSRMRGRRGRGGRGRGRGRVATVASRGPPEVEPVPQAAPMRAAMTISSMFARAPPAAQPPASTTAAAPPTDAGSVTVLGAKRLRDASALPLVTRGRGRGRGGGHAAAAAAAAAAGDSKPQLQLSLSGGPSQSQLTSMFGIRSAAQRADRAGVVASPSTRGGAVVDLTSPAAPVSHAAEGDSRGDLVAAPPDSCAAPFVQLQDAASAFVAHVSGSSGGPEVVRMGASAAALDSGEGGAACAAGRDAVPALSAASSAASAPVRSERLTLILVEDADVLLWEELQLGSAAAGAAASDAAATAPPQAAEEPTGVSLAPTSRCGAAADRGYLPALALLRRTSKCPIILTASSTSLLAAAIAQGPAQARKRARAWGGGTGDNGAPTTSLRSNPFATLLLGGSSAAPMHALPWAAPEPQEALALLLSVAAAEDVCSRWEHTWTHVVDSVVGWGVRCAWDIRATLLLMHWSWARRPALAALAQRQKTLQLLPAGGGHPQDEEAQVHYLPRSLQLSAMEEGASSAAEGPLPRALSTLALHTWRALARACLLVAASELSSSSTAAGTSAAHSRLRCPPRLLRWATTFVEQRSRSTPPPPVESAAAAGDAASNAAFLSSGVPAANVPAANVPAADATSTTGAAAAEAAGDAATPKAPLRASLRSRAALAAPPVAANTGQPKQRPRQPPAQAADLRPAPAGGADPVLAAARHLVEREVAAEPASIFVRGLPALPHQTHATATDAPPVTALSLVAPVAAMIEAAVGKQISQPTVYSVTPRFTFGVADISDTSLAIELCGSGFLPTPVPTEGTRLYGSSATGPAQLRLDVRIAGTSLAAVDIRVESDSRVVCNVPTSLLVGVMRDAQAQFETQNFAGSRIAVDGRGEGAWTVLRCLAASVDSSAIVSRSLPALPPAQSSSATHLLLLDTTVRFCLALPDGSLVEMQSSRDNSRFSSKHANRLRTETADIDSDDSQDDDVKLASLSSANAGATQPLPDDWHTLGLVWETFSPAASAMRYAILLRGALHSILPKLRRPLARKTRETTDVPAAAAASEMESVTPDDAAGDAEGDAASTSSSAAEEEPTPLPPAAAEAAAFCDDMLVQPQSVQSAQQQLFPLPPTLLGQEHAELAAAVLLADRRSLADVLSVPHLGAAAASYGNCARMSRVAMTGPSLCSALLTRLAFSRSRLAFSERTAFQRGALISVSPHSVALLGLGRGHCSNGSWFWLADDSYSSRQEDIATVEEVTDADDEFQSFHTHEPLQHACSHIAEHCTSQLQSALLPELPQEADCLLQSLVTSRLRYNSAMHTQLWHAVTPCTALNSRANPACDGFRPSLLSNSGCCLSWLDTLSVIRTGVEATGVIISKNAAVSAAASSRSSRLRDRCDRRNTDDDFWAQQASLLQAFSPILHAL